MNKRKLLAGPYLVWAAGFIILPLFMILLYGFTSEDGGFTFANIAAIADPIRMRSPRGTSRTSGKFSNM